MSGDLRVEVKRRMLARSMERSHDFLGTQALFACVPVREAVDVALALLREQRERWGHIQNCACHKPGCCAGYHDEVRDPRCAPGGERG